MQSGKYKIARPPFGFDIINGRLEVNEEQARIVRQIFGISADMEQIRLPIRLINIIFRVAKNRNYGQPMS